MLLVTKTLVNLVGQFPRLLQDSLRNKIKIFRKARTARLVMLASFRGKTLK